MSDPTRQLPHRRLLPLLSGLGIALSRDIGPGANAAGRSTFSDASGCWTSAGGSTAATDGTGSDTTTSRMAATIRAALSLIGMSIVLGGLVTGCDRATDKTVRGADAPEAVRKEPTPASFSARSFPTEDEPVPDGPVDAFVPNTVVDLPTMRIQVVGEGRPMILFERSAAVWHPTVQALLGDHSLHVVTVAGHGGQPPVEGPWAERIVEDLRTYMRGLGKPSPLLVVHGSLGARVALELGSTESEHVRGLVLAHAPPINSGRFKVELDALPAHAKQLRALVRTTNRDVWSQSAYTATLALVTNPHEGERLAQSRVLDDPRTGVELSLELLEDDGSRWMSKVVVPVLVVSGCAELGPEKTALRYCAKYKEEQRSLFSAIPSHEHVWMEQRGAFPMLDSPQAFSTILRAWDAETQ